MWNEECCLCNLWLKAFSWYFTLHHFPWSITTPQRQVLVWQYLFSLNPSFVLSPNSTGNLQNQKCLLFVCISRDIQTKMLGHNQREGHVTPSTNICHSEYFAFRTTSQEWTRIISLHSHTNAAIKLISNAQHANCIQFLTGTGIEITITDFIYYSNGQGCPWTNQRWIYQRLFQSLTKPNEYLLTNQRRRDQPVCAQSTNVSLKVAFPPHNWCSMCLHQSGFLVLT